MLKCCVVHDKMKKQYWLTIALDGSAEEEKMKSLLDMSYELTK